MFSSKASESPEALNRHLAVVIVKDNYWKSLKVVKQSGQLYLCQAAADATSFSGLEKPRHEIIFKASKIFSLCRIRELELAVNRFDRVKHIFNALFNQANQSRGTSFLMAAFQKIITTTVKHPNWLDVHICAYNGFVDFFKKTKLSSQQINAQKEPDMCTPLHLAILQAFNLTIKAILECNPDLGLLDSEHNSILHFAVMSKVEVLETILQLPGIMRLYTFNKKRFLPIALVCINKKRDNLRCLMSFGLTARQLTFAIDPTRDPESQDARCQELLDKIDNERAIPFSKSDLDELDLSFIYEGGCPLHWATNDYIIEKLLKDGFPIDTPNLNEETPLAVMVRKNRFKCVLSLLCNGANVNLRDASGDTPLLASVKSGNTNMVRCLLIFDADLNVKDANQQSPRHIAAAGTRSNYLEIYDMLQTLGARTCEPNSRLKCAKGCAPRAQAEDEIYMSEFPFNYNPSHQVLGEAIMAAQSDNSNSHAPDPLNVSNDKTETKSKKVCLINFDGGGVKGLFTVQMMIELNRYLKHELHKYFEWISGTSTGSLIAFLLARGSSLTHVRKLYFQFKDQILTGSRPYSAENIETLFKSEVGPEFRMKDTLSEFGKHLLITATRVDHYPPSLQVFRSYFYPGIKDSLPNFKTWKALRASSAAPTFFRSFPPYIDGGFLANNPTLDALTEFFRYQSAIKIYNEKKQQQSDKLVVPELALVLSFGNGQIKAKRTDLSDSYNKLYYFVNLRTSLRDWNRAPLTINELVSQIKSLVTNCNEHLVFRADTWCASANALYYRLNPLMSKKYSLNETNDIELIKGLWEVKVYARQNANELRQLAKVIDCMETRSCHPATTQSL